MTRVKFGFGLGHNLLKLPVDPDCQFFQIHALTVIVVDHVGNYAGHSLIVVFFH